MNDLLDDVQGQVRSIETRIEEINSSIQRNEEEVKALDKWTKGNEEWAKALDKRTKGNEEWAKALDTRIKGNEDWARVLDVRMDGIEEWIRLVYGEVQSLALETRAMKGDKSAVFKKTKFVSPEDFATKLLAMEGNLKINIGSGHRILENYINIDYRELPGVDIVCDVTELPFAQNSIAELASSHLIEHFREYEFINRILPHWFSMIEEGGSIRVICPNWEAMMEKLNSGEMSLSRFKELTFGGQEYEGNDHFSMYTPKTLRDVLTGVGFEEPELIVVDRDNGGCPEMELLAKKPESDY
jgi:predicted SAM-dependent methyltransferase